MKGFGTAKVTLVNEQGESKEFRTSTEASKFLGVQPYVITRMKTDPTRVVSGWHIENSKVMKMPKRRKLGIEKIHLAVKNFGSKDKDHPEDIRQFATERECRRFISENSGYVYQVNGTAEDRRLLRIIEQENGITI